MSGLCQTQRSAAFVPAIESSCGGWLGSEAPRYPGGRSRHPPAVAPVIGADADDIASSISFTAVLGVLVVLGLPFLVPILQLSLTQYGVLAGLTVHAVPQVIAATLPIGALSNQVGTVIKLVRVLMLGPVVLGLSLFANRVKPAHDRMYHRKPRFNELVPWFIIGFLVVLAVRSLGLIPQSAFRRSPGSRPC
jgi:uncharacterized membrane protein YadS